METNPKGTYQSSPSKRKNIIIIILERKINRNREKIKKGGSLSLPSFLRLQTEQLSSPEPNDFASVPCKLGSSGVPRDPGNSADGLPALQSRSPSWVPAPRTPPTTLTVTLAAAAHTWTSGGRSPWRRRARPTPSQGHTARGRRLRRGLSTENGGEEQSWPPRPRRGLPSVSSVPGCSPLGHFHSVLSPRAARHLFSISLAQRQILD